MVPSRSPRAETREETERTPRSQENPHSCNHLFTILSIDSGPSLDFVATTHVDKDRNWLAVDTVAQEYPQSLVTTIPNTPTPLFPFCLNCRLRPLFATHLVRLHYISIVTLLPTYLETRDTPNHMYFRPILTKLCNEIHITISGA